jgi:hypothetical protein
VDLPSGNRRHEEREVVLAEPDLDEIEEISAEQIPPDFAGAESDLQLERPDIGMGELNRVKRRREEASGHGLESKLGTTEHVKSEQSRNPPVDKRTLSSAVDGGVNVDDQRRVPEVRDTKAQPREASSTFIVAVVELVTVGDRGQTYNPIRTTPGGRGGST